LTTYHLARILWHLDRGETFSAWVLAQMDPVIFAALTQAAFDEGAAGKGETTWPDRPA